MILIISAAVTPLLLMNREKILYLLGGSKDMYPYAETYFTIYICGTFASLLGCGLNQFILAQVFAGFFLKESGTIQLAACSIRMYTFALLGIAVQYALADGLTVMGKVKYALPLSLFRKMVYMICLCILPLYLDIRYIFFAGAISDAVGALFSLILFWGMVNPGIRSELSKERGGIVV